MGGTRGGDGSCFAVGICGAGSWILFIRLRMFSSSSFVLLNHVDPLFLVTHYPES